MPTEFNPREMRMKANLNQSEFWARVGVHQTTGSRYENGRPVPAPVCMLLGLAYGTPAQAQKAFDALRSGH